MSANAVKQASQEVRQQFDARVLRGVLARLLPSNAEGQRAAASRESSTGIRVKQNSVKRKVVWCHPSKNKRCVSGGLNLAEQARLYLQTCRRSPQQSVASSCVSELNQESCRRPATAADGAGSAGTSAPLSGLVAGLERRLFERGDVICAAKCSCAIDSGCQECSAVWIPHRAQWLGRWC